MISESSLLWPIVIGLAGLLVFGLLRRLLRAARDSLLEAGPTWLFGNLPPLDVKSRSASNPTGRPPSGGGVGSLRQGPRDSLSVFINQQDFTVGDRFAIDKLFPAGFDEAGSVVRVQAGALPHQTLLVATHCVARSFGGEFTVAPLMRGKDPSPASADSTAFLYFAKPDPARPLELGRLERITVVVAGGYLMLNAVTKRFAQLASEMFGGPLSGSRKQRIWRAGDRFLVCEEEEWKDLRRATFIWTSEELATRETG
jgi:hypothetical protein